MQSIRFNLGYTQSLLLKYRPKALGVRVNMKINQQETKDTKSEPKTTGSILHAGTHNTHGV